MKDCWIKPSGEIVEVGDFMHNDYAYELLIKEMGYERLRDYMDEHHMNSAFEVLHERGWVRVKFNHYLPYVEILGGCIDLTKPMRNTIDPAMNKEQLKVAKSLCKEHNMTLHEAINDKRFW